MAITVKKKTVKLKTNAGASEALEEKASDAPQPEPEAATLNHLSEPSSPAQATGSFLPFVIMGVAAFLLLGALIGIQFSEITYYTGIVP